MLQSNARKSILNTQEKYEIKVEVDLLEDLDLILSNYDLTDKERLQCKLINNGYTIKEVAKLLKLAPITIYKRNTKIKQKILDSNIKFA